VNEPWSAPKAWPPGSRWPGSGHFALIGDDFDAKRLPVPLLKAETELLDRPTASKVLPMHPFGALTLFEHSMTEAEEIRAALTETEEQTFPRIVWGKCRASYRPGQPARSTFDRLLDLQPHACSKRDASESDLETARLEYLAMLCVFRGLVAWSTPAESDDLA